LNEKKCSVSFYLFVNVWYNYISFSKNSFKGSRSKLLEDFKRKINSFEVSFRK